MRSETATLRSTLDDPGRTPVIIASRAAPVVPSRRRGHVRWEPGAGGLVRVIQPALRQSDRWISLAPDSPAGPVRVNPSRPAGFGLSYLWPDRKTWKLFEGMCNRVLWFTLHGLEFSKGFTLNELTYMWEEGYRPVNAAFAHSIAQEWERNQSPILLQDYHLFSCTSMLRKLIPEAPIGIFCHTPFGGPEAIRKLPQFAILDILKGLLACDLIGFQSHRDLRRFALACSVFLGARADDQELVWAGRRIRMGVFPATVDATALQRELSDPSGMPLRFRGDLQVITWAGRSDPAKNPVGAVESFRLLLEADPALRGRVQLVVKIYPSRQHLPEYRACLIEVLDAIARTNAKFATSDWIPVVGSDAKDRVAALSALGRADVLFVNSIADGMNVVVQETALITKHAPAIALSHNTGAFERFGDLVQGFNPKSPENGASAMAEALGVGARDRIERIETMRERILAWGPQDWLAAQLDRLS